jgi:hypothetical protein
MLRKISFNISASLEEKCWIADIFIMSALLIISNNSYGDITEKQEQLNRHKEKVLSRERSEEERARQESKRIAEEKRQKLLKEKINVLEIPLDYSWGWNDADTSFTDDSPETFTGAAQDWVVLVNTHTTAPLFYGEAISGQWNKTFRSLMWAAPYQVAAPCMKSIENVHQSLALPLTWSDEKHRGFVTFILIPPDSIITYKIGNAKEQKDIKTGEERWGGGIQMRLKGLPAGTILLTEPLFNENKPQAEGKGRKKIDFQGLLVDAIRNYNDQRGDNQKLVSLGLADIENQTCSDYDWFNALFEEKP